MVLLCLDASKRFAAVLSQSMLEDSTIGDGLEFARNLGASQACLARQETDDPGAGVERGPLPFAAGRNTCSFCRSDVER